VIPFPALSRARRAHATEPVAETRGGYLVPLTRSVGMDTIRRLGDFEEWW